LILAYLAFGRRVNRTRAAAALSELISVGLLAYRDGRYSHSTEGASARECSEVKRSPQRRSGERGHRVHPRYRALEKVSIIPLNVNVPDREAHGVTPSPTPCGSFDTGPASSGSVPSAYCVTLRSSSVGYPSVILFSCLPACCLWCWLASTNRGARGCEEYYGKLKRKEIIHPPS
jgi:hypothetical protein